MMRPLVWHVGEPARLRGAKPRSPAGSAPVGAGGQGVSPTAFCWANTGKPASRETVLILGSVITGAGS